MGWWRRPARDGLILLTPQRVAVGVLGAPSWRADAQFAPDPRGLADLGAYCLHHPLRRFRILVLGGDEEFRFDTLPPVRGRDRRTLIRRRLELAFRGTPYRQARQLGPDALLLSALTQRDPLDAVVHALLAAGCAIAGIHTASALLGGVLARLSLLDGPTLLLSPLPDAGIQLAWLMPDGLRFARVGQGHRCFRSADPATLAPVLADEVALTLRYLAGERQLQRDGGVTVCLLDAALRVQQLAPLLQQHLDDTGEAAQVGALPLEALSAALKLSGSGDLPALMAGALPQLPLSAGYAGADACRFDRVRLLRRRLRWTGAAVLGVAVLGSAAIWLDARTLAARTDAQLARLRMLRHESQQVSDELVRRDVGDPVALRAVSRLYRSGMASWPSAEAGARDLSRIVAAVPGIRIDALAWDVAQPAEPGADTPQGTTWTQHVSLSGHVQPPADARQALQQVDALVARLRAESGMRVDVVSLPLDVRSQVAIRSRTDAPADGEVEHGFALTLTRTPGGGA
ncbi:hypothetical protein [Jeongeupia chitinilytica]|uniref:GspL periplasmic domain-containing protein n=1 Tax=Jeongeupia chitinilytica TaxID=1041641 RepID=A0ABQ3H0Q2_9NEIS|nr:hypothetical protein [Jeongeupia chitinilytica]GHD61730.1 hypothetical protein GCM10007350_16530 [Jeongeupia chitinilytica]